MSYVRGEHVPYPMARFRALQQLPHRGLVPAHALLPHASHQAGGLPTPSLVVDFTCLRVARARPWPAFLFFARITVHRARQLGEDDSLKIAAERHRRSLGCHAIPVEQLRDKLACQHVGRHSEKSVPSCLLQCLVTIESTFQNVCQSRPRGDLSTGQNRCLFSPETCARSARSHPRAAKSQCPVHSNKKITSKKGLSPPLKIQKKNMPAET